MENLIIKKSSTQDVGGVAFVRNSGAVIATSCRFENNLAKDGGVFRVNQNDGGVSSAYMPKTSGYSLLIDKCLFVGNSATASGGAIRMNSYGVFKIVNTTFVENYAILNGGAISTNSSYVSADTTSDVLVNVTIFNSYVENKNPDRCGGLITQAGVTKNKADANGMIVKNSLIYGNYRGGKGDKPSDFLCWKSKIAGQVYKSDL
ncbi:adhesin-like protein [Ochrovirga pacifica]|uniref:adhesin-like protein n=1 Tax=Ochrovirga pacifica TaxID=1042376 RepID=UPI000255A557|nr:adhesin-like protein [Ochrovirga pacifica]